MGKELGTGYQCHLYGNRESSKQLCRSHSRPHWRPELSSRAVLNFCLSTEVWALLGSSPLTAQSLLCPGTGGTGSPSQSLAMGLA